MSDELANARNRRSRQRRKQGLRSWDLDLPDTATEAMIDALIYYGRLSEDEADDPDRVAEEIAKVGQQLLTWWAQHWRELDRSTGIEIPPIRVSQAPPNPVDAGRRAVRSRWVPRARRMSAFDLHTICANRRRGFLDFTTGRAKRSPAIPILASATEGARLHTDGGPLSGANRKIFAGFSAAA